jgi:hypothetical protein
MAMMLECNNPQVGIYQLLDGLLSNETVPPGSKGAIFAIIDELRSIARASELRMLAERISLAIHALETALQRNDQGTAAAARHELKSIAGACLQARICPALGEVETI